MNQTPRMNMIKPLNLFRVPSYERGMELVMGFYHRLPLVPLRKLGKVSPLWTSRRSRKFPPLLWELRRQMHPPPRWNQSQGATVTQTAPPAHSETDGPCKNSRTIFQVSWGRNHFHPMETVKFVYTSYPAITRDSNGSRQGRM